MDGIRILLVEDDETLRKVMEQVLSSEGWNVTGAANGSHALQQYRQKRFDVVITDLIMPDKEGLETIRELRKMDPASRIIAMSGNTSGTYLKIAQHLGAIRTLEKPFNPSELLAAIREILP